MYQRLADSGTEAHLYGIDDGGAPEDLDVTIHAGDMGDYRDSWVEVHRPPEPAYQEGLALLAIQDDSGVRDGFFTSNSEEVPAINDHVRQNL